MDVGARLLVTRRPHSVMSRSRSSTCRPAVGSARRSKPLSRSSAPVATRRSRSGSCVARTALRHRSTRWEESLPSRKPVGAANPTIVTVAVGFEGVGIVDLQAVVAIVGGREASPDDNMALGSIRADRSPGEGSVVWLHYGYERVAPRQTIPFPAIGWSHVAHPWLRTGSRLRRPARPHCSAGAHREEHRPPLLRRPRALRHGLSRHPRPRHRCGPLLAESSGDRDARGRSHRQAATSVAWQTTARLGRERTS